MRSFLEKASVLACCLVGCLSMSAEVAASFALSGAVSGAGAPLVCSLLVALVATCLAEAVPAHAAKGAVRWSSVLPSAAYCAFAVVVPAGVAFLPLAAFDMVRHGRTGHAALAFVPLVVFGIAGTLELAPALFDASLCALAVLFARSSRDAEEERARHRRTRDALRERTLELEAANRDLIDRQEREARMAVLEERGRIAREIHDNVGHLLTRSILQTEAFQVVHARDEQTREEFSQVGATLHEALDTVRASVHGLRDDSVDVAVQLSAIAGASPVPVQARLAVESAPPEVAACLCAVVREALSNAAKHGHAAHADLSLIEHPGLWQLRVRDDGGAPASPPDRSRGMGLQSMEDRVRALGGVFRCGAWRAGAHGGFEVFASIPKREGRSERTGEAERSV